MLLTGWRASDSKGDRRDRKTGKRPERSGLTAGKQIFLEIQHWYIDQMGEDKKVPIC